MIKMSIRITCLLLLFTSCLFTMGEQVRSDEIQEGTTILGESPSSLNDPVRFLEHSPLIDGVLDGNLSKLSVRGFTRIIRDEYEGFIPDASYRLAYGTDFFYVYIEVEADSLICRDRAYQMGDGFHMVLARPRPDGSPSEEFYVLACSAIDKPRMEWSRH